MFMTSPDGAFVVRIPESEILLQDTPDRKAQLRPEDPTSGVPYATVLLTAVRSSLWVRVVLQAYNFHLWRGDGES